MILINNHELILLNDIINKTNYATYKCEKCNKFVFNTIIIEYKYFMCKGGLYRDLSKVLYDEWKYIELTCEEETIKELLE